MVAPGTLLALVVGGGLGTLARYFLGVWAQTQVAGAWPFGTFLVNVLGCLLMGVVFALFENGRQPPSEEQVLMWRMLVMTGFLGAFTTFSAYELEIWQLLREGAALKAVLYAFGSLALGFLALALAYQGTRWAVHSG